jgi:hypothetical protein
MRQNVDQFLALPLKDETRTAILSGNANRIFGK